MFKYLYLMGKVQRHCGNERGQGLTEYAAVLAVVVIIAGLVVGDGNFTESVASLYSDVTEAISGLGK